MCLTLYLGLELSPKDHVLDASSEPMQCAFSRDPLRIEAADHTFVEPVRAIPGLIYPLIMGVGWWQENLIHIVLLENMIMLYATSG